MSSHYYQFQLATEITVAAIQNGLPANDVEQVAQFFDRICETIEEKRIKWEDELTATIEFADDVSTS